MNTLDMRFDSSIIKGWMGKKFVKYKCDAFDFTNSVTQIIGLFIGDEVFSLTNVQESVDYYGNTDDIAVFKLNKTDESKIHSAFKDVDMISTPINNVIKSVKVVNEHQVIKEDGNITYDVFLTRAIIIEVGDREILFEKDIVPFSEEILIYRGYNLIEKCSDMNEFLNGWGDDVAPECSREILSIS